MEIVLPFSKTFESIVDEHEDHAEDLNDSPTDFIQAYLKEIESTTNVNSSFYKEAGRKLL